MDRITAFVGGIVITLAVALVPLLAWFGSVPSGQTSELEEQFGVTIVWFDDVSPCGEATDHSGCWLIRYPDTIYVESGFDADMERSFILHELGHVILYRLGQPNDECAADAFALSMGATWTGYDCS